MARTVEIREKLNSRRSYYAVRVNLEESNYAKQEYGYDAREVQPPLSQAIMVVGRFNIKPPADNLRDDINSKLHGQKKEVD